MKKLIVAFSFLCFGALSTGALAASYDNEYGQQYWDNSDTQQRTHIKRVNRDTAHRAHNKKVHRSNTRYQDGMARKSGYNRHSSKKVHTDRRRGARGEHAERSTHGNQPLEKAPLAQSISPGQKVIKIDLSKRVFGAYNSDGKLVKWGRVSGGKNYCADIGKSCRTPTGSYTIYSKKGEGCTSSRFPLPNGGARMPYCMHFHGGYAMHGGNVPNHNASHGCVRMHASDAKWLNQQFVQVGSTKVNISR